VQGPRFVHMPFQCLSEHSREGRRPVLASLPRPHNNLARFKVEVLDPQVQPSSNRIPVPYSSRATSCVVPLICSSNRRTSSRVRTTGARSLRGARMRSVSQGSSSLRTSR
jgi:hypothetical protein